MSRKDYVAAAEVIRSSLLEGTIANNWIVDIHNNAINIVANKLADAFAVDNHMFNRGRFLDAAGISRGL